MPSVKASVESGQLALMSYNLFLVEVGQVAHTHIIASAVDVARHREGAGST